MIPQSAVQIDQAGTFVLVVGADNKVEQRRVKLGRGPAGQSVVESGVEPGTLVITEGAQRARPGQRGRPRGPPRPADAAMISKIFVDRPRLAIVIAIVMTIAGAISLLQIPLAQFPDIVPPQVEVKARYPGASAEVVEATVGQLLESKVVGVDNMIYMKSTSGNDGSYTLLVSFALGTDPDQNTVNVNNRVQLANAAAAEGGPAAGPVGQEEVLGDAAGHRAELDQRRAGPAVHQQLRDDQHPRRDQAHPRRRRRDHARPARLLHADLVRDRQADRPGPDAVRHHRRRSSKQNRVAPVGRIGAQPIGDASFQLNIQTQGRLADTGGVRQHHRPRQSGRIGAAGARRGAARARRADPRRRDADQRQAVDPDRALPRARRQRGRRGRAGQADAWTSCGRASPKGCRTRSSTTRRSSWS